jgi:hypothetical protein
MDYSEDVTDDLGSNIDLATSSIEAAIKSVYSFKRFIGQHPGQSIFLRLKLCNLESRTNELRKLLADI